MNPPSDGGPDTFRRASMLPRPKRYSRVPTDPRLRATMAGGPMMTPTPYRDASVPASLARPSMSVMRSTIMDPARQGIRKKKEEWADVIQDHLVRRRYPHSLTEKTFKTPTGTSCRNIFQFIYQEFDPEFKFRKFDDDVLSIVRLMGYPFAREITRHDLSALGGANGWPKYLRMLAWMVGLVEAADLQGESHLTELSPMLRYYGACYHAFMRDEDPDPQFKENLFQELEIATRAAEKETQELEQEIERDEATIRELEGDRTLQDAIAKVRVMESDLGKIRAVTETLQNKLDRKSQAIQSVEAEIVSNRNELTREQDEIRRLEGLVRSQEEIAGGPIEALMSHQKSLEEQAKEAKRKRDQALRERQEAEGKLGVTLSELGEWNDNLNNYLKKDIELDDDLDTPELRSAILSLKQETNEIQKEMEATDKETGMTATAMEQLGIALAANEKELDAMDQEVKGARHQLAELDRRLVEEEQLAQSNLDELEWSQETLLHQVQMRALELERAIDQMSAGIQITEREGEKLIEQRRDCAQRWLSDFQEARGIAEKVVKNLADLAEELEEASISREQEARSISMHVQERAKGVVSNPQIGMCN